MARSLFTPDIVIHDGVWIDARGYGSDLSDTTLNAAVAAVTSDQILIISPGTWTIDGDVDFTCHVMILNGAVLNISGGISVSFAYQPDAGVYQIFSGAGTVTFGDACFDFYPEWWGIDGASDDVEINLAIDAAESAKGGTVWLTGRIYYVDSSIQFPNLGTANSVPVILAGRKGSTGNDSYGTQINWNGGNNDSIIEMSRYSGLHNLFVAISSTQTGIVGVDLEGAFGAACCVVDCHDVYVKLGVNGSNYGWKLSYVYYKEFRNCAALYCDVGVSIGAEVNANVFNQFRIGSCTIGISHTNGTARGNTWIVPIIEECTLGYECAGGGSKPMGLTFDTPYFEGNDLGMNLAGYGITVKNPYFNGSPGDKCIQFATEGCIAVEVTGLTKVNDIDDGDVYTLESDFTNYGYSSIVIGTSYLGRCLEEFLLANPTALTGGYLDISRSAVYVYRTPEVDASGAYNRIIFDADLGMNVNRAALVAAFVEVKVAIVDTMEVNFGRSGPNYDQFIDKDNVSGANVLTDKATGVYTLDIESVDTRILTGTYDYRFNNTAATSGTYRIVLVLSY